MHPTNASYPECPIDQPVLVTQRLLLRPFQLDDAITVNRLLANREIAANTAQISFPYTTEMATEWIQPQQRSWQQGRAAVFAITLAAPSAGGAVIGMVGLEIDSANERAEIGYWVGKNYWANGFCTEAATTLVSFGFKQLGLNRVFAYHMLRNSASGRVLEKIGMKREGILKQHVKKWGKFEDVALFGMLRPETEAATEQETG